MGEGRGLSSNVVNCYPASTGPQVKKGGEVTTTLLLKKITFIATAIVVYFDHLSGVCALKAWLKYLPYHF